MKPTRQQKIRLALLKIKCQAVDSPEGKLYYAIIERAGRDLYGCQESERHSAKKYLSSRMPGIEAAGIDFLWVRRLFTEMGEL